MTELSTEEYSQLTKFFTDQVNCFIFLELPIGSWNTSLQNSFCDLLDNIKNQISPKKLTELCQRIYSDFGYCEEYSCNRIRLKSGKSIFDHIKATITDYNIGIFMRNLCEVNIDCDLVEEFVDSLPRWEMRFNNLIRSNDDLLSQSASNAQFLTNFYML